MDRKSSANQPPLWATSLTSDNEIPSAESLSMDYDERNNISMNNVSNEEITDDNLDDNYFNDVVLNQNEENQNEDQRPNDDSAANYYNRVHSIHRNKLYDPQSSNITQSAEARIGGVYGRTIGRNRSAGDMAEAIEHHANRIVAKMERDPALMEDSPTSDELRKETLRDMPQCLTLKRRVKVKLSKSVSQKSKKKPLSCYKMFKYRMSIAMSKFKLGIKNVAYSLELWYGSVKQIEGNFGSGVASFFKFLRWIFVLNLFISIMSFAFIVIPQLTFGADNTTLVGGFAWSDLITGEGYLTESFLYYGFYSNKSVSVSILNYSMPDAYFFTMICLYLSCFAVFSISVAYSYRRSFIETEGGLQNVYAHKIFCGWDYNIATEDAARLKSHAIYTELKELLYEDMYQKRKETCIEIFWTKTMQVMMNILILIALVGIGYLMWFLMDKSTKEQWPSIYTAIAVNIIMTLMPIVFSWIIKYEGYKSPKTLLYLTLLRTFILGFVIIGVLVTFWLKNPDAECWETSLGQEIYRLVLFDFFFSVVLMPVLDLILYRFSRLFDKSHLHFDIARNTMQIIYNQTLFWVGFFFSPFLSIIVIVKLLLTWYARKLVVLHLCKPSSKTWRAAQTTTWFLMMAFLSLLLVMGLLGYIMSDIPTTSCGPFRDYEYMYQLVTLGLLRLREHSNVLNVLLFVTKPGFIALVLIALCGRVYYLRAKAHAQRGIVAIYRNMLLWESRDKEFLLQNISLITKGQWQYKIHEGRELDPITSAHSIPKHMDSEGDIAKDSSSQLLFMTPSSSSTNPTSSGSEIDADLYAKYKKFA